MGRNLCGTKSVKISKWDEICLGRNLSLPIQIVDKLLMEFLRIGINGVHGTSNQFKLPLSSVSYPLLMNRKIAFIIGNKNSFFRD